MATLTIYGMGGKPTRWRVVPTGHLGGGEIVLVPSAEGETHGVAIFVQDQTRGDREQSGTGITYWLLTLAIGLGGGELVYRLAHLFF